MTFAARRATSTSSDSQHVQENPGFARLIIERGEDRTELDLGADAQLFQVEPGRLAPTLTGEELAVDKALAVFGRAHDALTRLNPA